jgi:hypothetical protein
MPTAFRSKLVPTAATANAPATQTVQQFLDDLPAPVKAILVGPVNAKEIAGTSGEDLVLAMRAMDRLPRPRIALRNAVATALAKRASENAPSLPGAEQPAP